MYCETEQQRLKQGRFEMLNRRCHMMTTHQAYLLLVRGSIASITTPQVLVCSSAGQDVKSNRRYQYLLETIITYTFDLNAHPTTKSIPSRNWEIRMQLQFSLWEMAHLHEQLLTLFILQVLQPVQSSNASLLTWTLRLTMSSRVAT